MNNVEFSLFKRIGACLITVSVLLSGCGQGSQKPNVQQQSMQGGQQSEKIPDQLKGLEDNLEKIMKALDGPAVGVKEEKGQTQQKSPGGESKGDQKGGQDKQGGSSGGGKEQEGGKQGDDQKGGSQQGEGKQGSQQGQQQQAQPPQPQDPWQQVTPIINNMHYTWSSYMPMAAQKGASRTLLENFSTALNSLTNTIIGKNKTNTLMAASYLYAYIPDFYALHKTSTSPEIKRIRHYTRNAVLNGLTGNWTQADTDLNNLKSSWSLFKNTVSKEQQDSANKLDFSIMELEKVVREKNQPLADIKGRVVLSNVESMEKSMEQTSKGGGGSSGGGGGGSASGGGTSGGGGSSGGSNR